MGFLDRRRTVGTIRRGCDKIALLFLFLKIIGAAAEKEIHLDPKIGIEKMLARLFQLWLIVTRRLGQGHRVTGLSSPFFGLGVAPVIFKSRAVFSLDIFVNFRSSSRRQPLDLHIPLMLLPHEALESAREFRTDGLDMRTDDGQRAIGINFASLLARPQHEWQDQRGRQGSEDDEILIHDGEGGRNIYLSRIMTSTGSTVT